MSRVHKLNTWPSQYRAIISGKKRFEFRKNDRDFAVGDTLVLIEWDPTPRERTGIPVGATGRTCQREVTYILHGGSFGCSPGYVVMSLSGDES